jgi:hypothetical protein
MMRNIKAIPTIHRGLNMRSRLEARLAEMFTQLGLELVLPASGLRRLHPGLRYRPRLQAGPGRREPIYTSFGEDDELHVKIRRALGCDLGK